jgi:hypothetical protein
MPDASCFRLEEQDVQAPASGEVLIEVHRLSIDPFIRTSINAESYHLSVPIGGTVTALGVGRVLESAFPDLKPGDPVFGPLGVQAIAKLPGGFLRKLDEKLAPMDAYLGVLGLTAGLTSYFGVRNVGQVKAGEIFVVSAAAGAVGSLAGQIAKLEGARVIGIAGGAAKVRHLIEDLGFAAAIDYKGEDVAERLRALAPDGVDVFFDNVGGEILDVVLDQIRTGARVVICGAISQYQNMEHVRGPSLYLRLAERHARMEGFAVTHFAAHFAEAEAALARWLADGKITLHEHVEHGLERFPETLVKLFDGSHTGKLLLEVAAA